MAGENSLGKPLAALAVLLLIGGTAPWWRHRLLPPGPPYMGDMLYGVYFQGNDVESELAESATIEEDCLRVCLQDARCKAMSFVQAPWGGGVCRLKDKVPARTWAPLATSAVKVFPP